MSFKDIMELRIPSDTDAAWYAQSIEEWQTAMSTRRVGQSDNSSQSFVGLLKDLWQSRASEGQSSRHCSSSITLMYGILSIARELVRRDDTIVATKASRTSTLAHTVENSLALWEQAWRKAIHSTEIPWMMPTCSCLLQLARNTLFEISPVDLQVVAGGHVVDGKRRGRADYANALRKIKLWAREERGIKGMTRKCSSTQLVRAEDQKGHWPWFRLPVMQRP